MIAIEKTNVYHGESYTNLYHVWRNMKSRCNNSNNPRFFSYGGRGIYVCDEWDGRNSYPIFQRWALISGYEKGLTIERIDNNGPYSPKNCKWVPHLVNSQNMRNTKLITAYGETKSAPDWSRDPPCVVSSRTLGKRIDYGWDPEIALTKRSERANYKV